MGPDLIPVRGDGRASLDGRGQLERTGAAVVVAVDGRVRRVSDGVAVEREKWVQTGCYCKQVLRGIRTSSTTGAG